MGEGNSGSLTEGFLSMFDLLLGRFVFWGLCLTVGLAYWFVTTLLQLDVGLPQIELGWTLFGVTTLSYLFGPKNPITWFPSDEEQVPHI